MSTILNASNSHTSLLLLLNLSFSIKISTSRFRELSKFNQFFKIMLRIYTSNLWSQVL